MIVEFRNCLKPCAALLIIVFSVCLLPHDVLSGPSSTNPIKRFQVNLPAAQEETQPAGTEEEPDTPTPEPDVENTPDPEVEKAPDENATSNEKQIETVEPDESGDEIEPLSESEIDKLLERLGENGLEPETATDDERATAAEGAETAEDEAPEKVEDVSSIEPENSEETAGDAEAETTGTDSVEAVTVEETSGADSAGEAAKEAATEKKNGGNGKTKNGKKANGLRVTAGSMVIQDEPREDEEAEKQENAGAIMPKSKDEAAKSEEQEEQAESAPPEDEETAAGEETEQDKKKKKVETDLSGFRYIKYRTYESSGGGGEFISRSGLTRNQSKIEQGMKLKVVTKIGEKSRIEGDFDDMPNQDKDMLFKFAHGRMDATLGNFGGKVEGGELSPFSKTVDGVQINYKSDATNVMFLTSKSESQTKTITFTGRNIKGPYELNARDLMPDNIVVKLNNTVLASDEYLLDAFSGEITFYEILGPDDEVTITYERKLTGGLNEGNLSGLSVTHQLNRDWKLGFSRITKEASGTQQQIVESVKNETPTISADGTTISVANKYIVRSNIFQGTESITVNGALLEPNAGYNVVNTVGEGTIYRNYADGKFVMTTPLVAGDTVSVNYSYFPESVLECPINVDLIMDQGGGNWGYPDPTDVLGTLYYGSETIILCDDEDREACGAEVALERNVDYWVDEELNRIYFYSSSSYAGKYPKITTMCAYPDYDAFDTTYDQVVRDFRFEYEPKGKNYTVYFERAQSEADISTKPISVINEIVVPAAASVQECSDSANRKACTFSLLHQDIVTGSFVLYFNDRISDDSVVTQYQNYILDTTQGTIEMTSNIPAGTVVIADYRYNPPFIGVTTGTMDVLKTNFKVMDANVNFSMRSGDTFFTPVGGESNFEVKNMKYGFSRDFGGFVSVTANWINVENAMDVFEQNKSFSKQSQYNFTFAPQKKLFTKLNFTMSDRDRYDDYNPSQTDTSESRRGLSLGLPVPFLKNADASISYDKAEQEDNTQSDIGRETTKRAIGINYKPSKKLQLSMNQTVNEIDSRQTNQQFTSTNTSRKIGVKWIPMDTASVNLDLDSQNTSDSRESVEDKEIQSTRMNFSYRPKSSRVKNFTYSFTRQDRPSITGPSSGARSSSFSINSELTETISFSPKLSISKSTSGDSSTKSETRNYQFNYLPPGKPYRVAFTIKDNETTTSRPGGGSGSTTKGWDLSSSYDPSDKVSYTLRLQSDSQSSTSSAGFSSLTIDANMSRHPSETVTQSLSIRHRKRSGGVDQVDTVMEFGHNKKLSDILSFDFRYRLQKFENGDSPNRSFTGHLVESTLRADF